MNQHELVAWIAALGPYISGCTIGLCAIVAALLARSR